MDKLLTWILWELDSSCRDEECTTQLNIQDIVLRIKIKAEQNSVVGNWDTSLYSELSGLTDDVAIATCFYITEDLKGWTEGSVLRVKRSLEQIFGFGSEWYHQSWYYYRNWPLTKKKKECEAGTEISVLLQLCRRECKAEQGIVNTVKNQTRRSNRRQHTGESQTWIWNMRSEGLRKLIYLLISWFFKMKFSELLLLPDTVLENINKRIAW